MTKRKDEEEVVKEKEEVDVKEVVDESARLKLSEEDLKKLEEILLNPPPPNEALKNAAKKYEEEVVEKKSIFPEGMEYDEEYNRPVYNTKTEISQEERKEILVDIIKHDEEIGLYNEPFDNPMIKKGDVDLKEIAEKLQDRELFPESNQRAKEIIENSNLDAILMDGLGDEDWSSFEQHWIKQTEEELSTIEPTEEEESRNFSTITPEPTNFFQKDEYVPSLSDEEVNEMVLDEWERNLDMDEEQDGIDDQTSDTEKKKS
jgi:hypothetical protein